MCQVTLEIPDQFRELGGGTADGLAEELRMLAAVKLFEMQKISAGAAAEFAGIAKPVFLSRLADYGVVAINYTEADLAMEARLA